MDSNFAIPISNLKIISENGVRKVFDRIRKKYIILTPEEFVRQNFVEWLVNDLHYPVSLISNEVFIKLNDTKKRCDTVVFDKSGMPLVIIEYKAPYINLGEETLEQIIRYNMALKARFLIVSNGVSTFCWEIDYIGNQSYLLENVPDYSLMLSNES